MKKRFVIIIFIFFLNIFINCMNYELSTVVDNFREGGYIIEGTKKEIYEMENIIYEMKNSDISQYKQAIKTIQDKGTIIKIDKNNNTAATYKETENIIIMKSVENNNKNKSILFHEILHLEQDIMGIYIFRNTLEYRTSLTFNNLIEHYTAANEYILYVSPEYINDKAEIIIYFDFSFFNNTDYYTYKYLKFFDDIVENNYPYFNPIYNNHRGNKEIERLCIALNKLSRKYSMAEIFDQQLINQLEYTGSSYWDIYIEDVSNVLNGKNNHYSYILNTVDDWYYKKLDEGSNDYYRYPDYVFDDFLSMTDPKKYIFPSSINTTKENSINNVELSQEIIDFINEPID